MRPPAQRLVEQAKMPDERRSGINVKGCADRGRNVGQRNVLGMQLPVTVEKMIHVGPLAESGQGGQPPLGRWPIHPRSICGEKKPGCLWVRDLDGPSGARRGGREALMIARTLTLGEKPFTLGIREAPSCMEPYEPGMWRSSPGQHRASDRKSRDD